MSEREKQVQAIKLYCIKCAGQNGWTPKLCPFESCPTYPWREGRDTNDKKISFGQSNDYRIARVKSVKKHFIICCPNCGADDIKKIYRHTYKKEVKSIFVPDGKQVFGYQQMIDFNCNVCNWQFRTWIEWNGERIIESGK